MRDERFKATCRGGSLSLQRHHLLAAWAADCAEHVLLLFSNHCPNDNRPEKAVEAARAWSRGEITVGEARAAAIAAHAAAREAGEEAARYVARAAGHAAATAHMADHAPGAAVYALKAVHAAAAANERNEGYGRCSRTYLAKRPSTRGNSRAGIIHLRAEVCLPGLVREL